MAADISIGKLQRCKNEPRERARRGQLNVHGTCQGDCIHPWSIFSVEMCHMRIAVVVPRTCGLPGLSSKRLTSIDAYLRGGLAKWHVANASMAL